MRNKHVVITEEMHMALKMEAARSGIPLKKLIMVRLEGKKDEKKPLRW